MLFAFAPIKWIAPIKTTRITASMIAYSPTPWPCSDRSLFKLKRPKLLASRKSLGSRFTFSLHRQEWPNSGNPKVTTTGLTTVIKKPIRLGYKAKPVEFHVMQRKKIDLKKVLESLNAICPSCGHSISPAEIRRVDFQRMRCPKCGSVFAAGGSS